VLINGEKVFSTLDEHQKHFYTGYDQLVFKIPQHLVTKNELDFRIEIHDLNSTGQSSQYGGVGGG
jgi:hypothetical protein